MVEDGELPDGGREAVEAEVDTEIDAAVEFADASPLEDVATLERHVYAPVEVAP
jgi:TPP-dependent pyruvate/acetoin dehydrogenase alpha subunit